MKNNILEIIGENAIKAKHAIHNSNNELKNKIISNIAKNIKDNYDYILQENQIDLNNARSNNLSAPLIDRLTLNPDRLDAIVGAIYKVINLDDPSYKVLDEWEGDNNGLLIQKISVPIGVLGMIYEARPNVTVDASILSIKSGNAIILRSGSSCLHSSVAFVKIIQQAISECGVDPNIVQIIPSNDREIVNQMLTMDNVIDLIIPRGGKSLCSLIKNNSKIPTLQHLDGNCHTYIHKKANLEKALSVIKNAKLRRVSICGATESLVIDKDIAKEFIPKIVELLFIDNQCLIYGDQDSVNIDNRIELAKPEDWGMEYLDKKISIKIVNDYNEAINWINKYSSHHTDSIITDDQIAKDKFLKEIDSAIVMHNTSTQFADGEQFAMGAEIGIATGKLHARGPIGVNQLNSFKYCVTSDYKSRK